MAIFDLLIEEHVRLRSLLKEAMSEKRKGDIFEQLRLELERHMEGEEEHVYPETRSAGLVEQTLESIEEHHVAKILLGELHEMTGEEDAWGPKLKVLHEQVIHHIVEEERELFPPARERIAPARQEDMEDQYRRFESAFISTGAGVLDRDLPFYHNA